MAARKDTPSLIAGEFPGRDELIGCAYRENRSFRDLCQDYSECAAALEGWRRSDDDASSLRAREYAELLGELESEIELFLESLESESTPMRQGGLR